MKTTTVSLEQRNREVFFSLIGKHLGKLYEFVRTELDTARAAGDVMPREVTSEDIVDEVVLRAYQEFAKNPNPGNIRDTLMKLARERVKKEIGQLRAWHRQTVHTEEDIPETPPEEGVSTLGDEILDFYEPDEDLKLEDIIPDLSIPTPEQVAEMNELRLCLSAALAAMPRQWRRALLLCHVEGLAGARLAKAVGKSEPETQRLLEHARHYLREKLMESGCDFNSNG